jgi:hypothetical protein
LSPCFPIVGKQGYRASAIVLHDCTRTVYTNPFRYGARYSQVLRRDIERRAKRDSLSIALNCQYWSGRCRHLRERKTKASPPLLNRQKQLRVASSSTRTEAVSDITSASELLGLFTNPMFRQRHRIRRNPSASPLLAGLPRFGRERRITAPSVEGVLHAQSADLFSASDIR